MSVLGKRKYRETKFSVDKDSGKISLKVAKTEDKTEEETDTEKWPSWVVEADKGEPLVIKTFAKINVTKLPPEIEWKRGGIRVLKQYMFRAKVDKSLKAYPVVPGYQCYNVCKNRGPYHTLSPMILGPVHDENGDLYALNIEDGWQCSKVWPLHMAGCESDEWIKNWSEWSRRGRFSGLAKRHRTPKTTEDQHIGHETNKNVPAFTYYMGDKMDYVTARKRMYCIWYEKLAPETDAYKDLYARHLSGQNIILLDYDGLDRNNPKENIDLTKEKLLELVNDDSRPFGHGLVLASVLLGFPVWRMD